MVDAKTLISSLSYPGQYAATRDSSCGYNSHSWVFERGPLFQNWPNSDAADLHDEESDEEDLDLEWTKEACTSADFGTEFVPFRTMRNDFKLCKKYELTRKYLIEDWFESSAPLICITGESGSGMSSLIEKVSGMSETEEALARWRPNVKIHSRVPSCGPNELCSNLEGFYRDVLVSIFEDELADESNKDCAVSMPTDNALTCEELHKLLCTKLQGRATCLFVDNADSAMISVLQALSTIPDTKICFTAPLDLCKDVANTIRIEQESRNHMITSVMHNLRTPLREPRFSAEACFELATKIVDGAKGVWLICDLAQRDVIAAIRAGETPLLDFEFPSSLDALCTSILGHDRANSAGLYFKYLLEHSTMMDYASWDCLDYSIFIQPDEDLSIINLALALEPELQDMLELGITPEFVESLINVVQDIEKDMELLSHGVIRIKASSLDRNLSVAERVRKKLDSPFDTGPTLELLPGAVKFLTGSGRAILESDDTSVEQIWHDLIEAHVTLLEVDLAPPTHVNLVLTPLSKIRSTDLLGRCHDLYCDGALMLDHGFLPDHLYPPFLSLAARPSFHEYVLNHAGEQATSILRHLLDHRVENDRKHDVLDVYYDDLVAMAKPLRKGVLALDVRNAAETLIVAYDSAVGRILKRMVQYSFDANEAWLDKILAQGHSLSQRTCLAVKICLTEECLFRVEVEDPDRLTRSLLDEENLITYIAFILEVDLALLVHVLRKRFRKDHQIPFHAEICAIEIVRGRKWISYTVADSSAVDVARVVECLYHDEPARAFAQETVDGLLADADTEIMFRPAYSVLHLLAMRGAGYKRLPRKKFDELRKRRE